MFIINFSNADFDSLLPQRPSSGASAEARRILCFSAVSKVSPSLTLRAWYEAFFGKDQKIVPATTAEVNNNLGDTPLMLTNVCYTSLVKKLEDKIREFLEERGWDDLKPADLAKSISIEAAELLEIFQWNSETLEEVKNDSRKLTLVKSELADVFNYSLEMAVLLGLDTEKIITGKIEHAKKKYPAKLMKSKGVKPGNLDVYEKIRSEYRKKGLSQV